VTFSASEVLRLCLLNTA